MTTATTETAPKTTKSESGDELLDLFFARIGKKYEARSVSSYKHLAHSVLALAAHLSDRKKPIAVAQLFKEPKTLTAVYTAETSITGEPSSRATVSHRRTVLRSFADQLTKELTKETGTNPVERILEVAAEARKAARAVEDEGKPARTPRAAKTVSSREPAEKKATKHVSAVRAALKDGPVSLAGLAGTTGLHNGEVSKALTALGAVRTGAKWSLPAPAVTSAA